MLIHSWIRVRRIRKIPFSFLFERQKFRLLQGLSIELYINAIIQVGDELKRSLSVCLSLHLKTSRSSNSITRIVPVFLIPELSIPRVIEESWVEFVLRFFLSISRSQSIKRNVVSRFLFFFSFEEDFFVKFDTRFFF